MRPSKGIVNLQKISTTCFGHEIEGTFNAKNMAFNYSYLHAAKFKILLKNRPKKHYSFTKKIPFWVRAIRA